MLKLEWRLAKMWGRPYLQARYKGEPWGKWYFRTSTERKTGWIFMPEFGVWRCNVSTS